MVWRGVVKWEGFLTVQCFDISNMLLETGVDSVGCLSYVLLAAFSALDQVDDIVACTIGVGGDA